MGRRHQHPLTRSGQPASLGALVLSIVFCLQTTACSTDDPPDDSASIAGSWRPVEADVPATEWTQSSPVTVDLRLTADGSWSASDGCNDLSGTFKVAEDANVSFALGLNATVGCSGPSLDYSSILPRVTSYEVASDELRLFAEDEQVLRLAHGK